MALILFMYSNMLETVFCLDALKDALFRYSKPDIFNTDKGSQFTSHDFTDTCYDTIKPYYLPFEHQHASPNSVIETILTSRI